MVVILLGYSLLFVSSVLLLNQFSVLNAQYMIQTCNRQHCYRINLLLCVFTFLLVLCIPGSLLEGPIASSLLMRFPGTLFGTSLYSSFTLLRLLNITMDLAIITTSMVSLYFLFPCKKCISSFTGEIQWCGIELQNVHINTRHCYITIWLMQYHSCIVSLYSDHVSNLPV